VQHGPQRGQYSVTFKNIPRNTSKATAYLLNAFKITGVLFPHVELTLEFSHAKDYAFCIEIWEIHG